ncbi:MAG: type I-C CRISPR-associated protein Cas5 [Calditrichaeota bacterium]|nr:MAG: type I-C CRISPR-associated protein Cas5 [Calditrichota bacterium]
MSYGIKVKVWGERACFTRPEMKVERVSYDVMTPSAARAIIEAIYWKPSIRWIIRRIHVLKPIRFENIRRNEVGQKLSRDSIIRAMRDGHSPVEIFVDDSKTRQQRAAMVLKNVCYIIEADFIPLTSDGRNEGKHLDIFNRRLAKGQCFYQPYLGTREFSAGFEPVSEDIPSSPLRGEQDLGWMFYDLDYSQKRTPMFFHAKLSNGILHVPSPDSPEVRK